MRRIVLVGAGHAHLHIAARARALAACGGQVILVDPGNFWYSGLATGMLGGQYQPADDQIDPRVLIAAQGGVFVQGRAESVDVQAQQLRLADGTELGYDYLSINVGSRVAVETIPGLAEATGVWPVKPISNLWQLRMALEARFAAGALPRVAVLGGGPTGCEIAANIAALAKQHGAEPPVTLISHSERLIKQAPAGAGSTLRAALTASGVAIRLNTRIIEHDGSALVCDDGERIKADIVVPAIGLQANAFVSRTGLPFDASEGLRVGATLQSVADPRVFAAGDCASLDGQPLPKLGVFGVRQAGIIHANLLASLRGRALAPFRPQRRWLAILNLGGGCGLATWGPFWWQGRASHWLKDKIDRRFMAGYRVRDARVD